MPTDHKQKPLIWFDMGKNKPYCSSNITDCFLWRHIKPSPLVIPPQQSQTNRKHYLRWPGRNIMKITWIFISRTLHKTADWNVESKGFKLHSDKLTFPEAISWMMSWVITVMVLIDPQGSPFLVGFLSTFLPFMDFTWEHRGFPSVISPGKSNQHVDWWVSTVQLINCSMGYHI